MLLSRFMKTPLANYTSKLLFATAHQKTTPPHVDKQTFQKVLTWTLPINCCGKASSLHNSQLGQQDVTRPV